MPTGKDHDGKKYALAEWHGLLSARNSGNPSIARGRPGRRHHPRMSSTSPAKPRRCGGTLNGSSARTDADRQIHQSSPSPPIHSSQKAKACSAAKRHVYVIRCSGFSATNSAVPPSSSLNWDSNFFFLELTASPTLDTPAEKASRIFAKRCDLKFPVVCESYIATLTRRSPTANKSSPRGFPPWFCQLAKYTRTTVDDGRIILRCYLPAAAGHNLLLASELAMVEPLQKCADCHNCRFKKRFTVLRQRTFGESHIAQVYERHTRICTRPTVTRYRRVADRHSRARLAGGWHHEEPIVRHRSVEQAGRGNPGRNHCIWRTPTKPPRNARRQAKARLHRRAKARQNRSNRRHHPRFKVKERHQEPSRRIPNRKALKSQAGEDGMIEGAINRALSRESSC